jgi:hypothetical protein
MTDNQKDVYDYRLARTALCLGYALGQQGVYADINLNKVSEYLLENLDNMEIPLNGLKPFTEYMTELSKD